jgi:hypothetical protein
MTDRFMSSALNAYVVIFDGVSVYDLTMAIDQSTGVIVNWLSAMPGTVFVASEMTATELTAYLRAKMPKIERILVLNGKTDRGGRLPQSAWDFLNDPTPKPRTPSGATE